MKKKTYYVIIAEEVRHNYKNLVEGKYLKTEGYPVKVEGITEELFINKALKENWKYTISEASTGFKFPVYGYTITEAKENMEEFFKAPRRHQKFRELIAQARKKHGTTPYYRELKGLS